MKAKVSKSKSRFKKRAFCIQCANYNENQQQKKIGRPFTCTVMQTKQIASSPINPAHMIKEPSYAIAEVKNKNNDCQDFLELDFF